jgi:cysteine desulfurase
MATAPLYLDFNATTPLDPRVAAAMKPVLEQFHGNPSSSHVFGQRARQAVETARAQVAELLGTQPENIIFTSGGTEANNHAILGAAFSAPESRRRIVTSRIEHPAVTEVCQFLERFGFVTTYVDVDAHGTVDPDTMISALDKDTALVTLMLANNEVGTLQPVSEVAAAARRLGIPSHSDCAQAVGKIPVKLDQLGVDLISVAGHKLYAPQGIGVLVMREGVSVTNLMHGAGHEKGRRAGTENILEIVALGEACALVSQGLESEMTRLAALRDTLAAGLVSALDRCQVHGHPGGAEHRLPNTLSIGFADAAAQDIMAAMPEVAVSAGAACHGGGAEMSHVLQAMGVAPEYGFGTLRISLGRTTTANQVDQALAHIVRAVQQVRGKGKD